MIMAAVRDTPNSPEIPSLRVMNGAMLLAGLATMLLGPILPVLSHRWSLTDSQAGLLLLAQFTGATLGGATVSKRLPRAFLTGLLSGFAGFLAFAVAPVPLVAYAGLLVGGFGVGRIIASVNIIAGDRYTHHRGSALARLNISFSLGCLLSPLLAAQLAPRIGLAALLSGFAALFLLLGALYSPELRHAAPEPAAVNTLTSSSLLSQTFVLFALILFLYGGLETCLSGWLTTYALRYGGASLLLSQYTMVLLLSGLTAGRAVATWLLKHVREATLLRISLAASMACAAGLASAAQSPSIAALAVLLGICIAPIFPTSFALYMATRPTARQAGLVLAASGLGAAAIPALMGVISTRSGSLRLALGLPVATAAALLLISFAATRVTRTIPGFPPPHKV